VSNGLVSLPFLASRVQSRTRHRLVSAGPSAPSKRVGPGLASAPQLARSAVRVPNGLRPEGAIQSQSGSAANLFVHEGARQQLERSLRRVLGQRIVLAITDNRREMVSARASAAALEVRVHHMFLDADRFTQQAVGRYLRYGDRAASLTIGAYIEANQQRIRPAKRHTQHTDGRKHDLRTLFDHLNDTYFQGMVDASITWARRSKPASGQRASIKLGTYCADKKLIRIHPTLDRSWVPRYFIEYIIFHEMLHHMMPMPVRDGRRELHSPEFRQGEQRYRNYARALAWEAQHISRVLRS
jgi:hypothetical protein